MIFGFGMIFTPIDLIQISILKILEKNEQIQGSFFLHEIKDEEFATLIGIGISMLAQKQF